MEGCVFRLHSDLGLRLVFCPVKRLAKGLVFKSEILISKS